MDVRLPNGTVIRGIPEGTSKDEIRAKAISKGLATAEDFGMPVQDSGFSLEGAIEDIAPGFLKSAERAGTALKEAAPEPSTIGGMAGATVGTMIGGPAGGVAGSFLGTAGGELIEKAMKPGEMTIEDYVDAGVEGAVAAGIDVATLGIGKMAGGTLRKAGSAILERSPQLRQILEGYKAANVPPQQAFQEIAEVGSEEAMKRSQQFLSERGATLTAAQFPNATKAESIKEAIGRSGFLAGRNFNENAARVNTAVNDEFNKLFSFSESVDQSTLGSSLNTIIQTGKEQLGMTYKQGMAEVTQGLSKKQVSGKPVAGSLKEFLEDYKSKRTVEVFDNGVKKLKKENFYSLQPKTREVIEKAIGDLDKTVNMDSKTLLDMQRLVMAEIDEIGTFGTPGYNAPASVELAKFSKAYREAVQRTLQSVDPKAANKLKQINKTYSEGLSNLFPPINESFVKKAGKEGFQSLGKLLTSQGQIDNAKALMNSVRTAYAKVLHEVPKGSKEYAKLPYKTPAEAVDAIRSSYVKELMPTAGDEVIDITTYSNLAKRFQNKNVQAKAKEVLGDKFVPFMDLLNTIDAASKVPEGAIPSLFIRSKEYAALQGKDVAGAPLAKAGAALTVFGIPEILAKGATNPKHVNRIKGFAKTKFDSAEEAFQKFSIIANDIMAPELEQLGQNVSNILGANEQ